MSKMLYSIYKILSAHWPTVIRLVSEVARPQSQLLYIHVFVSDLYIPTIDLPILLQEIYELLLRIYNLSQTHECGNWD
jgi:hypothetical protein